MLVEKQTNDMIGNWIESMRLRTLPVSVAGVIAGCACSILMDSFRLIPALLCLVFAVLAQIAANFGNEYYDFKHGIDKKGREGFRRGVTKVKSPLNLKMSLMSSRRLMMSIHWMSKLVLSFMPTSQEMAVRENRPQAVSVFLVDLRILHKNMPQSAIALTV